MPRVLVVSFAVCPAPDRDGAELLNLLEALGPRYPVDALVVRGGDQPFVDRLHRARVLRVPVGAGSLAARLAAFGRAAARLLEGDEYDVVHLRGPWAAEVVLPLLSPAVRLCYEPMGPEAGAAEEAVELLPALAEAEAACAARGDLIVARSELSRRALVEAAPHLAGRITLVPAGVDVDRFDWEPAPPGDGALRVLCAGRIGPGRAAALEPLVEALAAIRRMRVVRLAIAGSIAPDLAAALDARALSAGAPGLIEWLGMVEPADMPRVYAAADVCVTLPSAGGRGGAGGAAEPWDVPLSMLEAMACRRAVVAPRRAAVEELVEDGREALLFSPGDAGELGRAIERLLADTTLRAALAEKGYALVRRRHTASSARRHLLFAYARLLPPSSWLPPRRFGAPDGGEATPTDAAPAPLPDTDTRRMVLDEHAVDGEAPAMPSDGTARSPIENDRTEAAVAGSGEGGLR